MMKLLQKEFSLSMHPITWMMLLLSAMVLIPNYPYVVIFFYVSMAIFFTCLSGRENHDIIYSLNLPVAKKSIVKARFAFAILLECAQLLLMIPFVLLNQKINPLGNQAGMDANLALFGVAFVVYGLFHLVFFCNYYKNVMKVGVAFVKSSILLFCLAGLDVVSSYAVPLVRDVLDTPGNEYFSSKLLFLAAGFVLYLFLTALAYAKSTRSFANQDFN